MDLVRQLASLGWTETEAGTYLALVQHPGATGYDLAKRAGLSRANVYAALGRLERRGAVLRQGGKVATYRALPFERLAARMLADYRSTVEDARAQVASLQPSDGAVAALGEVHGREAVERLAGDMLAHAQREIWLAQTPAQAGVLETAASDAERRGACLHTLCLANCPSPCGHCHGELRRAIPEAPEPLLLVGQDDRAFLWADSGAAEPTAVYGESAPFVHWMTTTLRGVFERGVALAER